jgi:hypothetical protein
MEKLQGNNEAMLMKHSKNNPEKMGTTLWINRRDPMESQDGGGVEQFAHGAGMIVEPSSGDGALPGATGV